MDEFVAGHPALDFANSGGGGARARGVERLGTWDDLVAWCRGAGLGDDGSVPAPADPDAALAALRAFRDDLHAFLTGTDPTGTDPTGTDPTAIRDVVADAYRRSRLAPPSSDRPGWTVSVVEHGPDVLALRIALAVGALLGGPELARVGRCGRCAWVFLDPSPSRRRRWCSMATCGNRAKQDRLRASGLGEGDRPV